MKTMQVTVIEALEGYAQAAGNQITKEYNWSNTGSFFVFLEDGPHQMRFSFQTDYVTLKIDNRQDYAYWYTKHWETLMTALRMFAYTGQISPGRS